MLVMGVLTVSLFVLGYGYRGPGKGRINRFEAAGLIACFTAYTAYLAGVCRRTKWAPLAQKLA